LTTLFVALHKKDSALPQSKLNLTPNILLADPTKNKSKIEPKKQNSIFASTADLFKNKKIRNPEKGKRSKKVSESKNGTQKILENLNIAQKNANLPAVQVNFNLKNGGELAKIPSININVSLQNPTNETAPNNEPNNKSGGGFDRENTVFLYGPQNIYEAYQFMAKFGEIRKLAATKVNKLKKRFGIREGFYVQFKSLESVCMAVSQGHTRNEAKLPIIQRLKGTNFKI